MNSTLVWIIFPGIVAVLLYIIRHWRRWMVLSGTGVALLLAGLAGLLEVDQVVAFGPWSFSISDTFFVLGRRFVLGQTHQPVLIMMYLGAAFWFAGSNVAGTDRLFIPAGLGITVLLIAALAVEPFLYAALLIEMAALVSVPLLNTPGKGAGRGLLRFLTYQTIGVPFILFTGWTLSGIEAGSGDLRLVLNAALIMALGFAFLLAIFPFHTWMPMLGVEAQPYAVAFVFYILPLTISLFGINFLDRYAWLNGSRWLYAILRIAGVLMVLLGGFWIAFQNHLGRVMGYVVMVEIGLTLLAISLGIDPIDREAEMGLFFSQFLPRGLSLAVLGMGLSAIDTRREALDYTSLQGIGHQLPIATGALLLAYFSLAGFPLLAGFPTKIALIYGLFGQFPLAAMAVLLSSVGIIIGGLRATMSLMVGDAWQDWQVLESWDERILLTLGGIALFIVGLFPQLFLPSLAEMAHIFLQNIP